MAKKKTVEKTSKRTIPQVNGKSAASGEKPEQTSPEKIKRKIMNEENLAVIDAIKRANKEGAFSIGEIAREMKVPFQKVRHFAIRLAAMQSKSLVKVERAKWSIE